MIKFNNTEEIKLEDRLFPEAELKINASLVRHENRIWCAYRTDSLDERDAKNYLTEMDEQFVSVSHKRLTAENGNTAFEDIRLFSYQSCLLAVYTYLPGNKEEGWEFEYGVGIGVVDVETGTIREQKSLRSHSEELHSKNWIPFEHLGQLYIMTDTSPFIKVLRENNHERFTFTPAYTSEYKTPGWSYGNIRGGTPFISPSFVDDGWLYSFIHSHTFLPNGVGKSRYYVFTVLRFNPVTTEVQLHDIPMGYSKPEKSDQYNKIWLSATRNLAMKVVFPMGILNYGEGVIMSFGKDDCVSRAIFYKWDYLKSLFTASSNTHISPQKADHCRPHSDVPQVP